MLWFTPWIFVHETVGWRGVMLPALVRTGMPLWAVNFVAGVVWSAFHVMVIVKGAYIGGGHDPNMLVATFTPTVMFLGAVFNHLRMDTGSILPTTLIHAMHDVQQDAFLGPYQAQLMANHPNMVWVLGETGVVMMVAVRCPALSDVLLLLLTHIYTQAIGWTFYLYCTGKLTEAYRKALVEYELDDAEEERTPLIQA